MHFRWSRFCNSKDFFGVFLFVYFTFVVQISQLFCKKNWEKCLFPFFCFLLCWNVEGRREETKNGCIHYFVVVEIVIDVLTATIVTNSLSSDANNSVVSCNKIKSHLQKCISLCFPCLSSKQSFSRNFKITWSSLFIRMTNNLNDKNQLIYCILLPNSTRWTFFHSSEIQSNSFILKYLFSFDYKSTIYFLQRLISFFFLRSCCCWLWFEWHNAAVNCIKWDKKYFDILWRHFVMGVWCMHVIVFSWKHVKTKKKRKAFKSIESIFIFTFCRCCCCVVLSSLRLLKQMASKRLWQIYLVKFLSTYTHILNCTSSDISEIRYASYMYISF